MARFIEKIIRSPAIALAYKKSILESTVINADNVADYFYQGSDQEVWTWATDFPNAAPPFGHFFVECKAPTHIVSRVHGVRPWSTQGPQEWGVLCTGTDIAQRIEATRDPKHQRELLYEIEFEILRLWRIVKIMLPWASLDTLAADAARANLDDDQQLMVGYVVQRLRLVQAIEEGAWDLVRTIFSEQNYRWTLDLLLFVGGKHQGKEYVEGPLWHLRLYVKADGTLVLTPKGEALLMEEALGRLAQQVEIHYQTGGNYMDFFNELHQELTPFLQTAVLTISFLHCRNVTLQAAPTVHKPLSNKQRRRGDPQRPRITYHVLDIQPMRQILSSAEQKGHEEGTRAIHLCRGYFGHYEKGRGLFGKYPGIYWFNQKVRGRKEKGIALKDYRIRV